MELAIATTEDIFQELRCRHPQFVFAGVLSWSPTQVRYACQGESIEEIQHLIRELDNYVRESQGDERVCPATHEVVSPTVG